MVVSKLRELLDSMFSIEKDTVRVNVVMPLKDIKELQDSVLIELENSGLIAVNNGNLSKPLITEYITYYYELNVSANENEFSIRLEKI